MGEKVVPPITHGEHPEAALSGERPAAFRMVDMVGGRLVRRCARKQLRDIIECVQQTPAKGSKGCAFCTLFQQRSIFWGTDA